jgi:hypothetical protein
VGSGARRPQGRCSTKKGESDGSEGDGSERRRRGEWGQPRPDSLYLYMVHRIYPLWLLAPYNTPQRLYPEKLARRLRRIFRQETKCYDLNLNLGRQPNKKITSGRPDGKHDLQAPTSYKIRSLANHFAKTTKYMTEESERYMDHLKLQAIYDLTGSRIQGGVPACHLIGSRTRGYKPPTTLLDPEFEGTQVAYDLIGSRTRHAR